MNAMLYTLPGGAILIALSFWALQWICKWSTKLIAVLLAAVSMMMYLPFAALHWPGMDVVAIHIAVYLVVVYVLSIVFLQRRRHPHRRGWHWGPALIVAFFVGVVAVEAVLVVLAQRGLDKTMAAVLLPEPRTGATGSSRFPGTVSHDFHEKTDHFNNYRQSRHAQLARGWHVKLGWEHAAQVNRPNRLLVHVNNDQDRPLDGATVQGRFLRPSNKALDRSFTMTGIGDGLYTVDLALPAPGHWDVVLTIARKDKVHEVRANTSVATRDD